MFCITVSRCGGVPWPEDGYLECSSNDFISGTECSTICNPGYKTDTITSIRCTGNHWTPASPPDCKRMYNLSKLCLCFYQNAICLCNEQHLAQLLN